MEIYLGGTDPVLDGVSGDLFLIRVVTVCMSVIVSTVLCLVLLGQRSKNKTYFNRLYGNIALATLLFGLFLRPGTILRSIQDYGLSAEYCTLYVLLLEVETIAVPMMVLMLLIERAFYLEDRCCKKGGEPGRYKSRMTALRGAVMITLPWFVGFLIAAIKTFGLLKPITIIPSTTGSNNTSKIAETLLSESGGEGRSEACHLEGRSDGAHIVGEVILFTFRSSFPVVYLALAAFNLAIWWRYYIRCLHPNNNNIYQANQAPEEQDALPLEEGDDGHPGGDQNMNQAEEGKAFKTSTDGVDNERSGDDSFELPTKPTCSLLVTLIICFMTICVTIASAYFTQTRGWLDGNTQWLFFIVETTAVVLPCLLFPEMRQVLFCSKYYCCRLNDHCCKRVCLKEAGEH